MQTQDTDTGAGSNPANPIACVRPVVGGHLVAGLGVLAYLVLGTVVAVVAVRGLWLGQPLPLFSAPAMYWGLLAMAAVLTGHALRILIVWIRANVQLSHLHTLEQRVAAHRWTVRHYQRGGTQPVHRYRLRAVFQAPDGRWYEAESDEFRANPEARMTAPPLVLLDPVEPRHSVVDMDSIPSVLETVLSLWHHSRDDHRDDHQ